MVLIYLADFNHKHQKHITFPYPVGLVASYALAKLGDQIAVELFKDFDEFRESFRSRKPDVVGCTNYMWNSRLSCQAIALIKKEHPEVVCVLGGANYSDDPKLQRLFLESHPAIDFYVYKEGEFAFTALLKHLIHANMDVSSLKSALVPLDSVHYLQDGQFVQGHLLSRIRSLDEIPSPYLTGTMDKFFDQDVSVLIQRTRGCPFTCTFCTEGTEYYNKVNTFSTGRLVEELLYCAKRLRNLPGRRSLLHIADANFGMFLEDLEVGEKIGAIRREWGWPKKIEVPTGKNKRERVVQVVDRINAGGDQIVRITASVQSTDQTVLKNIKRANISMSSLIKAAQNESGPEEPLAYGEIILALPGDTFEVHTQSIKDLIADGIQKISHQYLTILPGTEMDTLESREKFGVKTAFRVMPGAYGKYRWDEREFQWFETEERAIANDTLSFEDYLRCLEYDLTIETFFNDNLFDEFLGLLKFLQLPLSLFMDEIFSLRSKFPPGLDRIYRDFVSGRKAELWEKNSDLIETCGSNPELIETLIQHENNIGLGNSKAKLIFSQMEGLHEMVYQALVNYLKRSDRHDGFIPGYLQEATINSLSRKSALLEEFPIVRRLHYDFLKLHELNYIGNPEEFFEPCGLEIVYSPNPALQKKYAYLKAVEPDQVLRWRKLLFEPRVDTNDEFCRQMKAARAQRPLCVPV
ncbi:MAG: cobalamin B12-binding domain-containing protein [Planctomycetes bacterium]|nr:cobalamin B12-binding domain-containing protein [Planctomycetota bacterium]